jgi:hypothetical protein
MLPSWLSSLPTLDSRTWSSMSHSFWSYGLVLHSPDSWCIFILLYFCLIFPLLVHFPSCLSNSYSSFKLHLSPSLRWIFLPSPRVTVIPSTMALYSEVYLFIKRLTATEVWLSRSSWKLQGHDTNSNPTVPGLIFSASNCLKRLLFCMDFCTLFSFSFHLGHMTRGEHIQEI